MATAGVHLQVDPQSVSDFLAPMRHLTVEFQERIIKRLLDHLPLVEAVDTAQGEAACMEAVVVQGMEFGKGGTRDALTELCAYVPGLRGAILQAAAARLVPVVRASRRMNRSKAGFQRALRGLGARDKAVFRLLYELEGADGVLNTDFTNWWRDLAQRWSVEPIRDDPTFRNLLHLYDMAEEIIG